MRLRFEATVRPALSWGSSSNGACTRLRDGQNTDPQTRLRPLIMGRARADGGAVVRPARLIFLAFSRLQFPLPRNDPQTDRCTQCRHITSVRVPGHRQDGQPICVENSGNRVSPSGLRLSGGRAFASNATPASAGGPDPRTARPRIRT